MVLLCEWMEFVMMIDVLIMVFVCVVGFEFDWIDVGGVV